MKVFLTMLFLLWLASPMGRSTMVGAVASDQEGMDPSDDEGLDPDYRPGRGRGQAARGSSPVAAVRKRRASAVVAESSAEENEGSDEGVGGASGGGEDEDGIEDVDGEEEEDDEGEDADGDDRPTRGVPLAAGLPVAGEVADSEGSGPTDGVPVAAGLPNPEGNGDEPTAPASEWRFPSVPGRLRWIRTGIPGFLRFLESGERSAVLERSSFESRLTRYGGVKSAGNYARFYLRGLYMGNMSWLPATLGDAIDRFMDGVINSATGAVASRLATRRRNFVRVMEETTELSQQEAIAQWDEQHGPAVSEVLDNELATDIHDYTEWLWYFVFMMYGIAGPTSVFPNGHGGGKGGGGDDGDGKGGSGGSRKRKSQGGGSSRSSKSASCH